jgi:HEAT repeat protein
VPRLASALEDPSAPHYRAAIDALVAVAHVPQAAIEALHSALAHPQLQVRTYTVHAVGLAARQSDAALSVLSYAMRSADPHMQREAAEAATRLGPRAGILQPELLDLVRLRDPEISAAAIMALGALGPGAQNAAPLLVTIAGENYGLEAEAAAALARIGGDESGPLGALAPYTESPDPDTRARGIAAVGALAASGALEDEDMDEAIGFLTRSLLDESVPLRDEAARALGEVGEPARAALPTLVDVVKMQMMKDVSTGIRTIGQIGVDEGQVRILLQEMAKMDDPEMQAAAQWSLNRISPRAGIE